jgi:hypothetical protein
MNENIYRVLRTSAAYFADISALAPKTQRYITFVGLEASDLTLPLSPSVQNIIEEIPVFTDLVRKGSRNAIYLHKNFYWSRHRPYWAVPLGFK